MTIPEVEKMLQDEFRLLRNKFSLTEAQWEAIKQRVWERIKEQIT